MRKLSLVVPVVLIVFMQATFSFAHDYVSGQLIIEQPRMTRPLEGANNLIGYLTIKNNGQMVERFIGAKADFARSVQIHAPLDNSSAGKSSWFRGRVDIPPGEVLQLEVGGMFLIFMDVNQKIDVGRSRMVKLLFENAGIIEVEFYCAWSC